MRVLTRPARGFGFGTTVLTVLVLSWAPARSWGQTARLEPSGLSTVPTWATASRPFWQHLVIDLTRNVSAGNTIRIELPAGVSVADLDGDGEVEDEVSVVGDAVASTGYRSAAGSSPGVVQAVSTTGGGAGPVHVQFPITTPSSPAVLSYGAVTFANGGEQTIPAGTLSFLVVAPATLQLATPARLFVDGVADTSTNAQGDRYPAAATAAFAAGLPDLARDAAGGSTTNALSATAANGDDGDDVTYRFWWSTTDSLTTVQDSTATVAVDAASGAPAQASEGDSVVVAFDVSTLAAGTYYLYMTSDLTGTWPLVRSRGVAVTHAPAVLSVLSAASGDPDWLDSGLLLGFDDGQPGPQSAARDALVLRVAAVDFDDTASVRLFYAASGSLDTTAVTSTGSAPSRVITGLTGATQVDSTITLLEGVDTTLTWRVGADDSTVVTAGDYFLWAVATDGTELAIGRSDTLIHVRHSPFLAFDARRDAVLNTGGANPDRYYTISWNRDLGIEGDFDRDDTGGDIDLYYSDDPAFQVPGGTDDLVAAAADPARDTHVIVTGLDLDADGQDDNQYVWDLWTHVNGDDGGVPRAGVAYTIYGIVRAGGTQRLVRWEDGTGAPRTVTFDHDPHLTITAPLSALSVDGRRSFEVAWEAVDVDADAAVWVFLAPAGTVLEAPLTWARLRRGAATLWTATSDDGSLVAGTPLSEDVAASASVRAARLVRDVEGEAVPITDGNYAVYVVVDPMAGAVPADDSPAWRAPGTVTLEGFGEAGAQGLEAPVLEVLPGRATAVSWRDTVVFAVRPNTHGETVDVISVFLSIDTLLVDIVDRDSTQAGIQPFAVNPDLTGQTLFDSVKAGTDTTVAGLWVLDLVYFDQAGRTFDGDTDLATLALRTKNRQGTARLHVDNLEPRRSAFYRRGDEVGSLAPETGAVLDLRSRATLSGRLRLQGRRVQREEVTFELRRRNSTIPVSDSLFLAVNDVNSAKAGLQDSLDSLGSFTLTQLPTGTWSLKAHVDRYLDGDTRTFRADPGAQLTGLTPTWRADVAASGEVLLGGDVTGWTDTLGAASPDNEVDQLDVDFVTSFFGTTTTPSQAGALADIDGDSLVWVPDLNMVAANFGAAGAAPVYRRAARDPGTGPVRLEVAQRRDAGGGLTVTVTGDGVPELRAYGLTFAYDAQRWRPVDADGGGLFGTRPAVAAFRDDGGGRVHVGGALLGRGAVVPGDETHAQVRFEPRRGIFPTSGPGVSLVAATFVDGANQTRPGRWSGSVRPRGFALHPTFPNPFNPTTTLGFEVPVPGWVEVAVYDLAGQRVRTLLSDRVEAGLHQLAWDGRNEAGQPVATGTYIARLRADGFAGGRKMLLLR